MTPSLTPAPVLSETSVPQMYVVAAQQLKRSASWFYWIAGLSLLNSFIMLAGSDWNFIIGLGITQIFDGIAQVGAEHLSPSGGLIAKLVALALDMGVTGLFVLLGWLTTKRFMWSLIVGMVLYVADGVIFVLIGSWLNVGFHLFVLVSLYRGLKALSTLRQWSQPVALPS